VIGEQLEAANKNLQRLEEDGEFIHYKLAEIRELGYEVEELFTTIMSFSKRSYIAGQDTIFEAIDISRETGLEVKDCIQDNDPKKGLFLVDYKMF